MIRDAIPKDLPVIREIMNEAVLHSTAIYDYYERDEQYVQDWFKNMQLQKMPVLVFEQDGRCIGYACYTRFRQKDGFRFCVEHSVYVYKNARGMGVGKALLEALMIRAKQNGIHVMIAGIDSKNVGSIAFHRKYGFEQVAYMKEVGFKFDQWLDLVFMQKIL